MSAFDSNAFSTDAFSTGAFDFGAGPPPPPPVTVVPPTGTAEWLAPKAPTREQKRRSRVLHGIEREVVTEVAQRQVERLELDEAKRQQELRGELALRGIELESAHLEAMGILRQRIMDAEIAYLLRIRMEEEAAILIAIAAAIA